jgi:hypothetical protein
LDSLTLDLPEMPNGGAPVNRLVSAKDEAGSGPTTGTSSATG